MIKGIMNELERHFDKLFQEIRKDADEPFNFTPEEMAASDKILSEER